MRLNALSPSENPMEQLLYCFGGPDNGGNGGGSTHPGRPGGESGERGNRTDRGDGNDRDDRGGGSDSDPMGMADFAAEASRANAARGYSSSQASRDASAAIGAMDRGFGGGGDNDRSPRADITVTYPSAAAAGPNLIDSYLDGPMMADISTPMTGGDFVDPITGRGIMSDIPSMDYSTMSNVGNIVDPESDQDSLLGQIGPGGDVYDYSTDDIFGDLTEEQTRQQELVSQLRAGTPAASIVNPVRAPLTSSDIVREGYRSSSAPGAIAEAQARNALSGITDTRTGLQTGTMDRDTRITPSDPINPFGDSIFDSDIADRADMADLKARGNMTAAELAAMDALAAGPAAQQVSEARSSALGGPTPGSMPGRAADIEVTYGPEDLAKAQAELAAARDEAYSDKQFGFDTGLPESIDVFGVNVPTGIGIAERVGDALFDSEATLANAIAEYGIKSVDDEEAQGAANYNPQGLEVVTSGGPVTEGGRTVAYDARGNIVYDSRGIGGQISDLLTFTRPPENIQALYDKQRAIQDAEREREGGGDGGGQPIIPPLVDDGTGGSEAPVDDSGRDIVGDYNYQPRGPISYSYTGLPSLAPTRLQPSFRARGSYSPLFPIG